MIRDVHLLRQLLLDAEAGRPLVASVTNDDVVNRHVQLLQEAGLVQASKPMTMRERRWSISAITWKGYEVLDAIRDATLWETLTASCGVVPFDVLVRIAYDRAQQLASSRTTPVSP